jgi:hypothetical protein
MALTSEKYGFNGTIDCVGAVVGQSPAIDMPILLDWKSGKAGEKDKPDVYDSYKVQVAAYVYLYNEINPVHKIWSAVIVAIAKDKISYNTYFMNSREIDDCFNEVFLPALRIWNYQHAKKM